MRDSRRLPAWTAGLIFAGFAFLAGCLNSEERGTLHADGSGEIRFAYSMPEGKVDQDKKQEVHEAMAKARGIKILSDVDSTAGDTLWVGMVIHFDSIAVLDQLNDILPLKGTFQEMSWKRQNGENTLERTVRLIPAMPKDMGMPVKLPTYVQTIHWKVPGTIVSTDPLGTKSEDGSVASWKLPTDGASGTEAHLKLVWTDAGVTRVQLPWKGIALGALGLLLAFVLLVAWRFWRGRKEAVAIPDAPTTAAADPIMDVQAAEPLLSNPDPDEPSNRPLDFATEASPGQNSSAKKWTRHFLSPSLLLAAFLLFALAPVVNISCMGRTQEMSGWDLAYHRMPAMKKNMNEMEDLARLGTPKADGKPETWDISTKPTDFPEPDGLNDFKVMLWGCLGVALLALVIVSARWQGLFCLLAGPGLAALFDFVRRTLVERSSMAGASGMPGTLPAKFEILSAWYVAEALMVVVGVIGLVSFVLSFTGKPPVAKVAVPKGKPGASWGKRILWVFLSLVGLAVLLEVGGWAYFAIHARSQGIKEPPAGVTEIVDTVQTQAVEPELADSAPKDDRTKEDPYMDYRDRKSFPAVVMGDAVWMARNVAYEGVSSWCYEDDSRDCDRDGRMYDWESAQKACPEGWRLPTEADMAALVESAGGEEQIPRLKAEDWGNEGLREKLTGFDLQPAGVGGVHWIERGHTASLWLDRAGSRNGECKAWQVYSDNTFQVVDVGIKSRRSVRCLKR